MNALGNYLELTKPRLTLLVLASAFLGFFMAGTGPLNVSLLFNTLAASALLGGGVNALNQYLERGIDARMTRTQNRPIPSGRIPPKRALLFGGLLTITGILHLYASTNLLAGHLGLLTAASYLLVYTPLKQITPWNTLAGAIPGALPCMLGWAARQNALSPEAWSLFLILFFWQLPHFFAIAWVYKEDYDKSGLKMLTLRDADGSRTGKKIILSAIFLFSVTLLPVVVGLSHRIYLAAAVLSGTFFIAASLRIHRQKLAGAKKFVSFSIYYLLALIIAMAADKML